jgi:hypothetical protein
MLQTLKKRHRKFPVAVLLLQRDDLAKVEQFKKDVQGHPGNDLGAEGGNYVRPAR